MIIIIIKMFLQMGGHGDHIAQASRIRIINTIRDQASMIAVANDDSQTGLTQCVNNLVLVRYIFFYFYYKNTNFTINCFDYIIK